MSTSVCVYVCVHMCLRVCVGPWCAAELLSGVHGLIFPYGLWVSGHFLPGSLTYLYGVMIVSALLQVTRTLLQVTRTLLQVTRTLPSSVCSTHCTRSTYHIHLNFCGMNNLLMAVWKSISRFYF